MSGAAPSKFATPAWRFMLGWAVAWALVGCLVAAAIVFTTGADFWPVLRLSIPFAEVVGFTAFTSARFVFPLFVRLPYAVRVILEVVSVLTGSIFGSAAVILLQPLFSIAQFRTVLLIVGANAVIAVIVGIALNTYDTMKRQLQQSFEALREKEALERELVIARDVQRELLPRSVPHVQGLELAGICLPAIGVGGDYYDFLPLGDGKVGLIIADVSGKGIPAALLMAGLQASVRSLLRPDPRPAVLVGWLNQNLFQNSASARYATLFLGCYDNGTSTLCYSNAGHHPPIVVGESGVTRLSDGGLPVGMFENATYAEGHRRLAPGDLLVLFTDGVTETPDASGEEYGDRRLTELVLRHRTLDLDGIAKTVIDELAGWSGGLAAHDDVTLVLARVR